MIIGGDWNSTRNFKLDNLNYVAQNNKKTTKAIDAMSDIFSLVDPWRITHPNTKQYTWLQGILNKQARLDFFLCNEELLSITKHFEIKSKYRSDHAPITFKLVLSNNVKGPGTWKFNNSLLTDEKFITLIKKSIVDIKMTYAATPYNPDFVAAATHGLTLMIPPTLFWETTLVTLRGVIIDYSKKKKRNTERQRLNLEKQIDLLDAKVNQGIASNQDKENLLEYNNNLLNLRNEMQKGAYIRSRADWIEYGEKPSKYFLNLENRNRVNKSINEIRISETEVITDQAQILKNLESFYKTLYSRPEDTNDDLEIDLEPTKITEQEKIELDRPLDKSELDTALTQMKNNKSPGLDGYSPEFFKAFWPQLGHFLFDCVIECYAQNKLTSSQTQGLITCLPKTGKARDLLKNWRPISLLNTSYKLISLCITNRLKSVLSKIISEEQKGFLEGRCISDCTRLMYDLIYTCQEQKVDGLILLVDFQKAFDSLSWKFILKTLRKFNFGENFIKWINMFLKNSESRVILNGYLSDPFTLQRGCRQGDPISPYLFILCSEFLTLKIKTSTQIEGIKVLNKEHRLNQYADDTSLFLKAYEENLKKCLKILSWFHKISGLKINIQKTKVIRIGPIRETDRRFCRENDLEWVHKFTSLGIDYDVLDIENITEYNIEGKLKSMQKLIQVWLSRNITPIGRVAVYKSLILSKIIHILQSLPTPSTQRMDELERISTNFIWRNKRHEVNKKQLCKSIENGGLGMFNVKQFEGSLKIAWLTKLHKANNDWVEFANFLKMDRLIWTGEIYHSELLQKTKNPFWCSVIRSYTIWLKEPTPKLTPDSSFQHLWGNPTLNQPFNADLFKNNIIYVKDIFDANGMVMSKQTLELRIGKTIMLTTYFALIRCLPREWIIEQNQLSRDQNLAIPPILKFLSRYSKGTKHIRSIWENKAAIQADPPIGQQKWNIELNINVQQNWSKLYFLAKLCKLEPRTIYFQFQVLHRTIMTNKKLQQFNLRNNDECERCGASENISHLLYDCHQIHQIWISLENWLLRNITSVLYFDKNSIILGNPKNEPIVNALILITKHEIYKSKWKGTRVNMIFLKTVFKRQMNTEMYLGTIKGSIEKTLGKWASIANALRN